MKKFHHTSVGGGDDRLPRMRELLRNILDYALNGRVKREKAIAKKIADKQAGGSQSFSVDSSTAM